MNYRCLLTICLLVATCGVASADPPSLLRIFGRGGKAKPMGSKTYALSVEDGPWLILAATFVGENAQQRAEKLADEIRTDFGLPAYTYNERFDFTGRLNANERSARRVVRYANQYHYEAYAVLVGEYDSVEHRSLEKDLERIRTANPTVFRDPGEVAEEKQSKTPVGMVQALKNNLMKRKEKGPMAGAFVTRNPLLPKEYFSAPQVDSFVYELNSDRFKKFNLLQCRGKYTVVVRTFEGLETVVDGRNDKKFIPNMHRLDKFAAQAEKMVSELRKQGVEAYQFHDRFKSIVTVGSFEELGREYPDGRFEYATDVRKVMDEYRAFNSRVAKSIPGQGVAANHIASIPFDVQPTPIAVPKPSKRSLYSAALGRR